MQGDGLGARRRSASPGLRPRGCRQRRDQGEVERHVSVHDASSSRVFLELHSKTRTATPSPATPPARPNGRCLSGPAGVVATTTSPPTLRLFRLILGRRPWMPVSGRGLPLLAGLVPHASLWRLGDCAHQPPAGGLRPIWDWGQDACVRPEEGSAIERLGAGLFLRGRIQAPHRARFGAGLGRPARGMGQTPQACRWIPTNARFRPRGRSLLADPCALERNLHRVTHIAHGAGA